jgi:hypothetical protein
MGAKPPQSGLHLSKMPHFLQSAMFLYDFIGRGIASIVPGSPHFIPSILTKEIQELEDFLHLGHVFHLSDLVSSVKDLKGWLTSNLSFSS